MNAADVISLASELEAATRIPRGDRHLFCETDAMIPVFEQLDILEKKSRELRAQLHEMGDEARKADGRRRAKLAREARGESFF